MSRILKLIRPAIQLGIVLYLTNSDNDGDGYAYIQTDRRTDQSKTLICLLLHIPQQYMRNSYVHLSWHYYTPAFFVLLANV